MLIDTHCHLDFPDFDSDREIVLNNAKSAGVAAIINVASSLNGSRNAVSLAETNESLFASVGIHPHDSKDYSDLLLPEIETLAGQRKVVAIGEVGLDFYRNLSKASVQIEVFEKFITLSETKKLPLIVHSRLAQEQTLAILKNHPKLKSTGVVIHCFSGDADFLKKCLDEGFFVSFTCNITYKKADAIRQVVNLVPLDRMFLETDAPYLSPEGKRGRRNEPANVAEAAREVARIKQEDFEKVCGQTTQNAKKFFKIV